MTAALILAPLGSVAGLSLLARWVFTAHRLEVMDDQRRREQARHRRLLDES